MICNVDVEEIRKMQTRIYRRKNSDKILQRGFFFFFGRESTASRAGILVRGRMTTNYLLPRLLNYNVLRKRYFCSTPDIQKNCIISELELEVFKFNSKIDDCDVLFNLEMSFRIIGVEDYNSPSKKTFLRNENR